MMKSYDIDRRVVLGGVAASALMAAMQGARAQGSNPSGDRVFICNEDSNTLSVIDPNSNSIMGTVNLTSFDEDPRPPFRFVTGGVMPTHVGMVRKPLYHGAIDIHGAAPSHDDRLIATTGRGTSNIYLIDTAAMKVIGNQPNPQASDTTSKERLTSGVIIGREPHELSADRNSDGERGTTAHDPWRLRARRTESGARDRRDAEGGRGGVHGYVL